MVLSPVLFLGRTRLSGVSSRGFTARMHFLNVCVCVYKPRIRVTSVVFRKNSRDYATREEEPSGKTRCVAGRIHPRTVAMDFCNGGYYLLGKLVINNGEWIGKDSFGREVGCKV